MKRKAAGKKIEALEPEEESGKVVYLTLDGCGAACLAGAAASHPLRQGQAKSRPPRPESRLDQFRACFRNLLITSGMRQITYCGAPGLSYQLRARREGTGT